MAQKQFSFTARFFRFLWMYTKGVLALLVTSFFVYASFHIVTHTVKYFPLGYNDMRFISFGGLALCILATGLFELTSFFYRKIGDRSIEYKYLEEDTFELCIANMLRENRLTFPVRLLWNLIFGKPGWVLYRSHDEISYQLNVIMREDLILKQREAEEERGRLLKQAFRR